MGIYPVRELVSAQFGRNNVVKLACCLQPDTWVYHSNEKLNKRLLKSFLVSGRRWFQQSFLQRLHTHCLDCLPRVDTPILLPPTVSKILWRHDDLVCSCQWWTPCWGLDWCILLQAYYTHGSYDNAIMMTSHCVVLADEIYTNCFQSCQSGQKDSLSILPAIRYQQFSWSWPYTGKFFL